MPLASRLRTLCALVLLWVVPSITAAAPTDSTDAAFALTVDDRTITRSVMTVQAHPGEQVRLETSRPTASLQSDALPPDAFSRTATGTWQVSAPESPGLYPLVVSDTTGAASIRLQVFVLQPWDHDGQTVAGYRVGQYEQRARRGLETYEPPEGFVKVTADNQEVRLSPNFRLEQFLCKQTDETPQFALVQTRLLQTLEDVLQAVRDRGHEAATLHVMSGFRTPYYNRSIGNDTEYSRHLYGDAADIFVDTDGDAWMDDLTGDGDVTRADAEYLAELVEEAAGGTPDAPFEGGLGVYGPASHRGPFVHVDLRGYQARW